jgi:uncharacterized protein (DUF58 family)
MKHNLPAASETVSAKARLIELKTKKQVYGDMLGNNPSLFHGEGFEFAELREYVYGDDVRKIDWKTTAKLGRPYVKIYHEERQLNVVVVTMMSGSMYFGTVRQKSEAAAEAAAIVGFSAVKNGDLFSHMLFADKLYDIVRPSKKHYAVHKSIESLLSFDPLGKPADFQGMVDALKLRVKKKSLLFIISDFIGEIDLRVLAKKHDVFAIIVRDRFEENPQELGYLQLIDMETKESFEGNIDAAALKSYKKMLLLNDERLYKHFRQSGVRFAKVFTDEDVGVRLMKRMR